MSPFRAGLPVLYLVATLTAGDACAQEPPAQSVAQRAHGVTRADGELQAIGPRYKAAWTRDGIEFVPALGAAAPRNLPLRLRLESVGRDSGPRQAAAPVAPALVGDAVCYLRDGYCERYETRPDGIEQSFVFDRLPAGTGDLVVRLRCESELACASSETGGGLDFRREGIGGVRIGAVTGIDARDARAGGSVAYAAGVLELRLPARFVDTAALPLVLDPLIGPLIAISTPGDEEAPDVAHLATGGLFLVVWQRRYSSADIDVLGQRMNADGNLISGPIAVSTNSTVQSSRPRVAPYARWNRWIVVWTEQVTGNPTYVAARTVDGTIGTMGAAIQVIAGANGYASPDVGGDLTGAADNAVVVFQNQRQIQVEALRLVVSFTGSIQTLGGRLLSVNAVVPSIPATGGADGRYLIVWQTSERVPRTSSLRGSTVDRFLNIYDQQSLSLPGGNWESNADVDGDGDHWLLAFESRPQGSTTGSEIHARWAVFDENASQTYLGPQEVVVAGGPVIECLEPAVALGGLAAYVAYTDNNTALALKTPRLKSVDWFSCTQCEDPVALLASGPLEQVAIALAFSPNPGGMVAVWEQRMPSGNGDILAQRFREQAGFVLGPGPSCGTNVGKIFATCIRGGHTDFAARLEHAAPARPVLLVISLSTIPLNCGSCADIADPFIHGFAFPAGVTDARGNAAVAFPVPAGVGPITLHLQWVIVPATAPACPALGIDLSPRVMALF